MHPAEKETNASETVKARGIERCNKPLRFLSSMVASMQTIFTGHKIVIATATQSRLRAPDFGRLCDVMLSAAMIISPTRKLIVNASEVYKDVVIEE